MQPITVAMLMENFMQLYVMIKKLCTSNFKQWSIFLCEKGTVLQIQSHSYTVYYVHMYTINL